MDEKTIIKDINGQKWYCCPVCGKKLFHVNDGAVCRGVSVKCRGKFPDGSKCTWSGEIRIF